MTMKTMCKLLAFSLAAVLLLSACGKENKKAQTEDDADVNYGDYITPVVDRKVTECISEMQLSSELGYPVHLSGTNGDSEAWYESADNTCLVALTLENKSRAEFDTIAADPAQWTMQTELGEVAYWNVNKTELIAYYSGYAVSVATDDASAASMQRIMQMILNSLN